MYGQEQCRCAFDTSSYSAFGSRGACTAITRGGRRCEVRFGAVSYNADLVNRVISGVNFNDFRSSGFRITGIYLNALSNRNLQSINNVEYLATAIPYFLRSAYLGTLEPITNIDRLRYLDTKIVSFFEKNIRMVTSIFRGQSRPVDGRKNGDVVFDIGRGYVVVHFDNLRIICIVFPGRY